MSARFCRSAEPVKCVHRRHRTCFRSASHRVLPQKRQSTTAGPRYFVGRPSMEAIRDARSPSESIAVVSPTTAALWRFNAGVRLGTMAKRRINRWTGADHGVKTWGVHEDSADAVSVFSLILASAVPGSAQTNVFVNGNTTFTVTWQGVKPEERHSLGQGHVHVSNLSASHS